ERVRVSPSAADTLLCFGSAPRMRGWRAWHGSGGLGPPAHVLAAHRRLPVPRVVHSGRPTRHHQAPRALEATTSAPEQPWLRVRLLLTAFPIQYLLGGDLVRP